MEKRISIISLFISCIITVCVIVTIEVKLLPLDALYVTVMGRSMEPTLHDGQMVFGEFGEIERGDIVTICFQGELAKKYPELANGGIIKRIIGLPGDYITIKEDIVYVNEIALDEPYVLEATCNNPPNTFPYIELELKEGEYYVLGDNRGNSFDSRSFGIIDESELLYKQSTTVTWTTAVIFGLLILTFVIGLCNCWLWIFLLNILLTRIFI